MARLLLVDDEANILSSLRRSIHGMARDAAGEAHVVEFFTSANDALERAQHTAFDLVISDYRMPEMDGVEFLSRLIEIQPDIARMVLSGYADLQAVISAINKVQIFRFVQKPWDEYELETAIRQALEYRQLKLDNRELADLVRVQQGLLSKHELELKKLEEQFPGLTQVKRRADGSIDLDLDEDL
jgi:DNA-binding NtrC family response regulator